MVPAGVRELVHDGHEVVVETNAGGGILMTVVDGDFPRDYLGAVNHLRTDKDVLDLPVGQFKGLVPTGRYYLMAKVLLARQYARLVFDRPLHDRLLQEVVEAEPKARGFTLSNTLAQGQARELLAGSDEYF